MNTEKKCYEILYVTGKSLVNVFASVVAGRTLQDVARQVPVLKGEGKKFVGYVHPNGKVKFADSFKSVEKYTIIRN